MFAMLQCNSHMYSQQLLRLQKMKNLGNADNYSWRQKTTRSANHIDISHLQQAERMAAW